MEASGLRCIEHVRYVLAWLPRVDCDIVVEEWFRLRRLGSGVYGVWRESWDGILRLESNRKRRCGGRL